MKQYVQKLSFLVILLLIISLSVGCGILGGSGGSSYIDEISSGDKRILVVNGEPVPYALARFAGEGDFRGNLAKGGSSKGVPLSERDKWICSQVGPELKRRGILFAGLDVIGDWLSEVNVTSPTCIRELDEEFGLNIAAQLFDAAEETLMQYAG